MNSLSETSHMRLGGRFGGRDASKQIGELDVICHYCNEKGPTKFTC